MANVLIGSMRMFSEEHGTPNEPSLVHGFTQAGGSVLNQVAAIGTRYRLLVPALRGHSRPDNPDGTAAMSHRRFVRDIIALCPALGLERAAF